MNFKKGNIVYYACNSIGEISDVNITENGTKYRVNCCQFKNIKRGTSGGNVPVWKKGYPKEIKKDDINYMFVKGLELKNDIDNLKKELVIKEKLFESINFVYEELKKIKD